MNIENIKKIVEKKNEQNEREAVYAAEQLVEKILEWKNDIKRIEESIKDAQEKLKTLEAKTLTIEEVL